MSRPRIRVVVAGLGNVGRPLLDLLAARERSASEGPRLQLVGAADSSGAALAPEGDDGATGEDVDLDARAVLDHKNRGEPVATMPRLGRSGLSVEALLEATRPHLLFDATPSDFRHPAAGVHRVQRALERGVAVVLASKAPLVTAFDSLASAPGLRFSAAVCGALPSLAILERARATGPIERIEGTLNQTCQLILVRMAEGVSFERALAEAQAIGTAEPDPSLDVEGLDAAAKLVILVSAVTGGRAAQLSDVRVTGITGIRAAATAGGAPLRLLASATRRDDGRYDLRVEPAALPPEHPLAATPPKALALAVTTEALGTIVVSNTNPSPRADAAAMLADALAASGSSKSGR